MTHILAFFASCFRYSTFGNLCSVYFCFPLQQQFFPETLIAQTVEIS